MHFEILISIEPERVPTVGRPEFVHVDAVFAAIGTKGRKYPSRIGCGARRLRAVDTR